MDDMLRYINESEILGRQEIAADSRVGHVEFAIRDDWMEQDFGTLVPWHLAIEFLRLRADASVDKVWWRDSMGRIGHSGWSHIKALRDDRGLYQLNTLAGHPVLIEIAIENTSAIRWSK